MSNTKLGKSPGPDGFTLQYYKTLLPSLGNHLVKMLNGLTEGDVLHASTLQAQIAVIPKEGKDPSYCGSYRPISLLNTDLKLFTKILATRLQSHLPHLIHLDQVGFVPTREARDNTTKVLNLLYTSTRTKTPSIFLSTDAEKAFDRVGWAFMFATLRHVGLGRKMMHWILATYASPAARVRANGVTSDPFQITNGTRQGCPLSPLLFAVSLEPFLCHVRRNPDIFGVTINHTQHKVSAYADDLMFSLTNPSVSLPTLLMEFERYGAHSNLRINYAKSEAMGVGIPHTQLAHLQARFKLKWTTTALKYLGTHIPQTLTRLYELNFPPLLTAIRALLNKWNAGLHSWVVRCNILKMTILPKLLYLMQALPIHIPTSYFKRVQSVFTEFVWAKKRPLLSAKLRSYPNARGALHSRISGPTTKRPT